MVNDYLINIGDSEIAATTYGEFSSEKNCIIHVHGFKGFKDWGFNPYLAKYFSQLGYFVITFNFSHNGIGKNKFEFTELEKFASNTYSREIQELNGIIDCYKNGYFGDKGMGKIFLLGHSRGGGVSLMTASGRDDIDAIVLWASIATLNRYSQRQLDQWKSDTVFEMINARTKQVMKMNYGFIEDIEKNNLSIENSVKSITAPLLIVHGKEDLAVSLSEAKDILSWRDENLVTKFLPISGTGHTFNCKHPFEGSNDKFDLVLNETAKFLKSI